LAIGNTSSDFSDGIIVQLSRVVLDATPNEIGPTMAPVSIGSLNMLWV
jgi:hypothetical protein